LVLYRDARNVVVVHCLDGRSTTAFLICALLIYSALVQAHLFF
jgi:protein-tyrosine phosphatase